MVDIAVLLSMLGTLWLRYMQGDRRSPLQLFSFGKNGGECFFQSLVFLAPQPFQIVR